jgi:sec-independent protein translocase protein TatC
VTPEEEEQQRAAEEAAMDEHRMSLLEHLDELRKRLRNAGIAFIAAMILGFVFVEEIFEWLTRPIRLGMQDAGQELTFYVTGISEPFWVYFKLSIIAAIIVAAPFIFWELWKFVAPGLYKKEKKLALMVTLATAVCFSGGALFGYGLLTRPAAFYLVSILKKFDGKVPLKLAPMYTMSEIEGFQSMMLLGCGLAFELPVVLSLLGALGLVSARGLWKFNKYALILAALLGGILTPGADVVSQLLLAGPIYALYNLSILIVWAIERAQKRKVDEIDKQYERPAPAQ